MPKETSSNASKLQPLLPLDGKALDLTASSIPLNDRISQSLTSSLGATLSTAGSIASCLEWKTEGVSAKGKTESMANFPMSFGEVASSGDKSSNHQKTTNDSSNLKASKSTKTKSRRLIYALEEKSPETNQGLPPLIKAGEKKSATTNQKSSSMIYAQEEKSANTNQGSPSLIYAQEEKTLSSSPTNGDTPSEDNNGTKSSATKKNNRSNYVENQRKFARFIADEAKPRNGVVESLFVARSKPNYGDYIRPAGDRAQETRSYGSICRQRQEPRSKVIANEAASKQTPPNTPGRDRRGPGKGNENPAAGQESSKQKPPNLPGGNRLGPGQRNENAITSHEFSRQLASKTSGRVRRKRRVGRNENASGKKQISTNETKKVPNSTNNNDDDDINNFDPPNHVRVDSRSNSAVHRRVRYSPSIPDGPGSSLPSPENKKRRCCQDVPGTHWPGGFKFVQKGNCSYFVLPTNPRPDEYNSDFDEAKDDDDHMDDDDDEMRRSHSGRHRTAAREENGREACGGKPGRNVGFTTGVAAGSSESPETPQRFRARTPYETESTRFVGSHAATRPKPTLMEEWNWDWKMPKVFKKIKAEYIGVKRAARYKLFDRL